MNQVRGPLQGVGLACLSVKPHSYLTRGIIRRKAKRRASVGWDVGWEDKESHTLRRKRLVQCSIAESGVRQANDVIAVSQLPRLSGSRKRQICQAERKWCGIERVFVDDHERQFSISASDRGKG